MLGVSCVWSQGRKDKALSEAIGIIEQLQTSHGQLTVPERCARRLTGLDDE